MSAPVNDPSGDGYGDWLLWTKDDEIERLRDQLGSLEFAYVELRHENERLRLVLAQWEALDCYIMHDADCDDEWQRGPCSCGLLELLVAARRSSRALTPATGTSADGADASDAAQTEASPNSSHGAGVTGAPTVPDAGAASWCAGGRR